MAHEVVLIAHGRAETLHRMRWALEHAGDRMCVEARGRAAAVRQAWSSVPDVCVVQVALPGGGFDAAEAIVAQRPGTAVIMLDDSCSEADLLQSVRSGAMGYVGTCDDMQGLAMAVTAVCNGQAAVPRAMTARLLDELRLLDTTARAGREPGPLATLTRRERQVLDRLCEGSSTSAIARQLFVSPVTVRSHLASVMRKLGVSSRVDAVAWMSSSSAAGRRDLDLASR